MDGIGKAAQKIAASSQQGGGSLSVSAPSTTRPELATIKATQLFGCFRKDDASDPDTFIAAIAATLAQYPPHVVNSVCDPRSGLPSSSTFLPSVKEVRDACEAIVVREAGAQRRRDQEAAQLAERRRLDEQAKQARPTYEELQAKHGVNWGMLENHRNEEAQRKHMACIEDANRVLFERECKAAGVDPATATVSPSLAKLIKQKTNAAET